MSSFFTLEQAQIGLQSAYGAMLKAHGSLEYRHEGVNILTNIKHQSLKDLQDAIDYWFDMCETIEAGTGGVIYSQMVPCHE